MLSARAKVSPPLWGPENLTNTEKVALEVSANAQIVEWEMEYRIIQQGFSTRETISLRQEIAHDFKGRPELRAVWDRWMGSGEESYEFSQFINSIIRVQ